MKTKEVIRQLMKADPSGEVDVCVGNVDIHFIERLPAYYDGTLQVLVRDEANKYYNITGLKFKRQGDKVSIHLLSASDAIWNNHDLPIDYSELSDQMREQYVVTHDKIRQDARDLDYILELEYFTKHVRLRVEEVGGCTEDVDKLAKEFFDANLRVGDKIPEDIPALGDSYVGRRDKQWRREISVKCEGLDVVIEKNGDVSHG